VNDQALQLAGFLDIGSMMGCWLEIFLAQRAIGFQCCNAVLFVQCGVQHGCSPLMALVVSGHGNDENNITKAG
jgi:hypothetical protein